jgi:hypothetical protein
MLILFKEGNVKSRSSAKCIWLPGDKQHPDETLRAGGNRKSRESDGSTEYVRKRRLEVLVHHQYLQEFQ